jgi:hypothetical protein
MLLVSIILVTSHLHTAFLVLLGRCQHVLFLTWVIVLLYWELYFILTLAVLFLYCHHRKMLTSLASSMTALTLVLSVLFDRKAMLLISTVVLRLLLSVLHNLKFLQYVLMVPLNFVKEEWVLIFVIVVLLFK